MSVSDSRLPRRNALPGLTAGRFVGLFAEAWAHRRRRQRPLRRGALALAASAALLTGLLVGAHGQQRSYTPVARSFSSLTPDLGLGRHCAVINSVACDTIEFDLELKRPARLVAVTIDGRAMNLQPIPSGYGFPAPDELGSAGSGPWTGFYGYLQPSPTPTPVRHQLWARANEGRRHREQSLQARVSITYPDGRYRATSVESQPIRIYEGASGGLANELTRRQAALLAQKMRRAAQHR